MYMYTEHACSTMIISKPAIADKPRCSVYKLWQKYKCKKRASNSGAE